MIPRYAMIVREAEPQVVGNSIASGTVDLGVGLIADRGQVGESGGDCDGATIPATSTATIAPLSPHRVGASFVQARPW